MVNFHASTASLKNISDPVIISDKSGKVLWANEAADLLKKDLKELKDLFPPFTCRDISETKGVFTGTADLSSHFGFGLIFSLISIKCNSGEPETDCLISVLKAEELSANGSLESENDLSSVAHDLKNPLGAIFGYADALIDSPLSAGLSEKQKEVISRIRSTSVRSIELVKNFQQLSSLKSGEVLFSEKQTDLNQLIEVIHKGTWREKPGIPETVLELSSEPLKTNVEKILLDRVISNLYSNAIKFTPADGTIKIKSLHEEQYAVFSINNNLPLIENNDLPKIFNNRFRAKNSQGTSGTGLGLYIIKEIMQKIGGKIEAQSTAHDGTTFKASFPLRINEL